MAKISKLFRFPYSFERITVKNGRNVRERLMVEVTGYGYYNTLSTPSDPLEQRYSADIEAIVYESVSDVKPVIEFFELDGEVKEAALQHVMQEFEAERKARYNKLPNLTKTLCNLKTLIETA